MPDVETHIRILTPLAAGAIAVVQLAGGDALSIAQAIFRPRRGGAIQDVEPGRLLHGEFLDAAGEPFDDGLAFHGLAMSTPWVEFNLHGGVRIVQKLAQRARQLGAVLEHTTDRGTSPDAIHPIAEQTAGDAAFAWLRPLERWTQACLASASTQRIVEWLANQPSLWRAQTETWRQMLSTDKVDLVLSEVAARLEASQRVGSAWRGRSLAVIGPPNVGKSTLANRLAGRDMSLVADEPGTTRDWVGQEIAVQGWPVTIMDTAGLRTGKDAVEAEGIARALNRAAGADVRMLVLDASRPDVEGKRSLLDRFNLKAYDIVVYNKCDLPVRRSVDVRASERISTGEVLVSSLTGSGWSSLEREILAACGFAALQEPKPLVFCAELQDRLADVLAALQSQKVLGARSILDGL